MSINYARVWVGTMLAMGIINLAGGFLNGVVLRSHWLSAREAGVLRPLEPWVAPLGLGLSVLISYLIAWLYAAVRPRFGPGPRTAFIVALVAWGLGCVPTCGLLGLAVNIPAAVALANILVGLPVGIAAAMAAGKVYMEASPSSPSAR